MSNPSIFEIFYFLITGSMIGTLSAALMKRRILCFILGITGTLLSFIVLITIFLKAGRPPIFGTFESVMTIITVTGFLSLLQEIFNKKQMGKDQVMSSWTWGANLVLLFLLGFFPKDLNPDFYMYDDIRVIVFFHFRILASALFLYAALILKDAFRYGWSTYGHMGRNFLLTGAALFLISEFSGSLWCLNWFGDSWHWSKGFLKASCLFLTAMLPFHIPPNWNVSHRWRAVLGSLPAVGSLWVLFLH